MGYGHGAVLVSVRRVAVAPLRPAGAAMAWSVFWGGQRGAVYNIVIRERCHAYP